MERLTEAEIQKMVREASEHEAEDKVRGAQLEQRNRLDSLCYSVEKVVRDTPNLAVADTTMLATLVQEGRQALEMQDDARVASTFEKLEKEMHRVASATAASVAAGGDAPPGEPRKGVVDAEFEDAAPPG